jgi:mgtE-like transporter
VKKRNAFIAAEEELLKFVKPKVPKRTYREFEEILVIEFISVTGGVFAGALLAQYIGKIALVPGLLILLPGFLAMRGNISGSLAARLGEALHLGLLKHRNWRQFLHTNAMAAFTLSIAAAALLGLVTYGATWWFFSLNAPKIMLVAIIASIISNAILIPLTTSATFWLFRKGHDPDNIMAPYITTVGDIVSVASLILAVVLV